MFKISKYFFPVYFLLQVLYFLNGSDFITWYRENRKNVIFPLTCLVQICLNYYWLLKYIKQSLRLFICFKKYYYRFMPYKQAFWKNLFHLIFSIKYFMYIYIYVVSLDSGHPSLVVGPKIQERTDRHKSCFYGVVCILRNKKENTQRNK